MKKNNLKLKTFCPLPFNHISANSAGHGRVCCQGVESFKDDYSQPVLWKDQVNLYSYFNSANYKKIRLQMLKGKRPKHCFYCFNEEDMGVKSQRLQFIEQYKSEIDQMIGNTNEDGSISHPKITYIDMALGNKCNLKCRMCNPWASYIIGKDWEKIDSSYDNTEAKRMLEDKWYSSYNVMSMLKQTLPDMNYILTTGGEPLIIKEHLSFLKMIIREGFANRIVLKYNSNQTNIPDEIIELWKSFKNVTFNCSIEGFSSLNDYIRYPSKWKKLEKNIYFLDDLSHTENNIDVFIHTTLQAYNVIKIPELLNYLRHADFKSIYRFPLFIWVKTPEWLSPVLFPKKMRNEIADRILDSLEEYSAFFLSYNKYHRVWTQERIQILREFCEMIKNDSSQEKHLAQFIEETKKHDRLRKQSVLDVLPELQEYFA